MNAMTNMALFLFMQVMKLVFLSHESYTYHCSKVTWKFETQVTLHFVTHFWVENCCMRCEKIEGYVKIHLKEGDIFLEAIRSCQEKTNKE